MVTSWDLGPRLHICFGVGGMLNSMKESSPEIPDRGETSEIPRPPFGRIPTSRKTSNWFSDWKGTASSSKVCLQQFQRQDTRYRSIAARQSWVEQPWTMQAPQPTPDQQWVSRYWPHQLLPPRKSQDKRSPATTSGAYQPSCPILI